MMMVPASADACTSAIISGKLTPDGRPLLWKHRDTNVHDNRVDYIPRSKDVKYAFVAVVNGTFETEQAWMGTNEMGFSIINTASASMRKYPEDQNDMEGAVMYKALACCKNIAEFETWLKENQPLGVETNFGVIDAEGGAAYFETNSYDYVKNDINDPNVAPLGYMVFTNFSPSGNLDNGHGFIRHTTADTKINVAAAGNEKITPRWIFDNLSRDFSHPILGIDLVKNPEVAPEGWYYDMDFIPRNTTTSSVVIQGVKPGENPVFTTMWTILGYPPAAVAIPITVAAGAEQPAIACRISNENPTSAMCNVALERRAKVFPILRGSGPKYLKFSLLYNAESTGYMQRISEIEDAIFDGYETLRQQWLATGKFDKKALKKYYAETDFGMEME